MFEIKGCSLRLGFVSLDNLFSNVAFASLPLGGVVVLCNNSVIARLVGCFFFWWVLGNTKRAP